MSVLRKDEEEWCFARNLDGRKGSIPVQVVRDGGRERWREGERERGREGERESEGVSEEEGDGGKEGEREGRNE